MAIWSRRNRDEEQGRRTDRDRAELLARFEQAQPLAASVTMYMCWHGGSGHDFPADVMQAAARLRDGRCSEEGYTSLTFQPSEDDWPDFLCVLPFCELAYAEDADGRVIARAPDQR